MQPKNKPVAYILAAGRSQRLRILTKEKPKAFLDIRGKKLLEYHLDQLSRLGMHEAYIVIGYQGEIIRGFLGSAYQSVKLHYVENPEYDRAGHGYSLYLGKNIFSHFPIFLMHADVFCQPVIYERVLFSKYPNVIMVDAAYSPRTNDELLVYGRDSAVEGMGLERRQSLCGEYLGMAKLSSDFMTDFCVFAEGYFSRKGRKDNYEYMLDAFLKGEHPNLRYETIENQRWVNINYPEDFEEAKRIASEIYGSSVSS